MKKLFTILFCFAFISCYAQTRLKNLCVVYEAKDSLATRVRDFSFIFYKDKNDNRGIEFNITNVIRVDYLEDLDNNTEIYPIDRDELFELLEEGYKNIPAHHRKEVVVNSWYERACNTNHVIEKRDNYYIIYKVKMSYSEYLKGIPRV